MRLHDVDPGRDLCETAPVNGGCVCLSRATQKLWRRTKHDAEDNQRRATTNVSEESPAAALRCRTVSEFVHAVILALPALARRCVAAPSDSVTSGRPCCSPPCAPLAFDSVDVVLNPSLVSLALHTSSTDGAQRRSGPRRLCERERLRRPRYLLQPRSTNDGQKTNEGQNLTACDDERI